MLRRLVPALAVLLCSHESRAEAPSSGALGNIFHEATGPTLGSGFSRQKRSADGYYGRVGYRMVIEDIPAKRFAVSGWLGGEGWGARGGAWGVGWPAELAVGPSTPHVKLLATAGVSVLSIDRERDRTGVGILSPRGGLLLGVEFEPVRLMLDARATYRWHFDAPATPQVQLGLSLEFFTIAR